MSALGLSAAPWSIDRCLSGGRWTMRAVGLVLILIGLVSFGLPAYHHFVPWLAIRDNELRLIGGLLFILGGATLWFTRG
jgi:uncharacterized protein YjeT (DUF2065 family)